MDILILKEYLNQYMIFQYYVKKTVDKAIFTW